MPQGVGLWCVRGLSRRDILFIPQSLYGVSCEGIGEKGVVAEEEVTKRRGIFKLSEFDQN